MEEGEELKEPVDVFSNDNEGGRGRSRSNQDRGGGFTARGDNGRVRSFGRGSRGGARRY